MPALDGLPAQGRARPTAQCSAEHPHKSHQTVESDKKRMCPRPRKPSRTCGAACARATALSSQFRTAGPLHLPGAMRFQQRGPASQTVHFQRPPTGARRCPPRLARRAVTTRTAGFRLGRRSRATRRGLGGAESRLQGLCRLLAARVRWPKTTASHLTLTRYSPMLFLRFVATLALLAPSLARASAAWFPWISGRPATCPLDILLVPAWHSFK